MYDAQHGARPADVGEQNVKPVHINPVESPESLACSDKFALMFALEGPIVNAYTISEQTGIASLLRCVCASIKY